MTQDKYFDVIRAIARMDARTAKGMTPGICRYPVGSKSHRKAANRLREAIPTLFGMRLRAEYHRVRNLSHHR